ncbi:hypothetical protein D3C74_50180 [compost metagenome]
MDFNVTSTVTGRMSCSKPNLSAVPKSEMSKHRGILLGNVTHIANAYQKGEMRPEDAVNKMLLAFERYEKGESRPCPESPRTR